MRLTRWLREIARIKLRGNLRKILFSTAAVNTVREALRQTRNQGITPFCITIDPESEAELRDRTANGYTSRRGRTAWRMPESTR